VTQIDWETQTVLHRIINYTDDNSSINSKIGSDTNNVAASPLHSSNTNTSKTAVLVQILPGIVIVLFVIGSVFLAKKLRKKAAWKTLSSRKETNQSFFIDIKPATNAVGDDVDNNSIEISEISWTPGRSNSTPIDGHMHFLQEGAPSTLLPVGNYAVEIGKEPKPTMDTYFYQHKLLQKNGNRVVAKKASTADDGCVTQSWFQSVLMQPFFLNFGGSVSSDEEEEEEGSSAASSFDDSLLEQSLDDSYASLTMASPNSFATGTMTPPTATAQTSPYHDPLSSESPRSVADTLLQPQQADNNQRSVIKSSILRNKDYATGSGGSRKSSRKNGKRRTVSFMLPENKPQSSSSLLIEEEERIEIFYNAGSKSVLAAFIPSGVK
jgi:hypothetical protein